MFVNTNDTIEFKFSKISTNNHNFKNISHCTQLLVVSVLNVAHRRWLWRMVFYMFSK